MIKRILCAAVLWTFFTGAAVADLPGSGGIYCLSAPGSYPSCSTLGGNPGSEGFPFASALGQHNTPARAPMAEGSAKHGSRSVATGFATVPPVTLSVFGDINIDSAGTQASPVMRRTDGDYSGNGLFGLSIERIFVGEIEDYSANTAGKTMLGPGWLLNYELRLEDYGSNPALRTGEGMLVTFSPVGSVWRANPAVMAATIENLAPPDLNSEVWRLKVAGSDAVYGFDGYGYLLYMEDRNGNRLNLTYTFSTSVPEQKNLFRVAAAAPDNRYLEFEYDAPIDPNDLRTKRLKKITASWNSRSVLYEYYTQQGYEGQLHKVKDGFGRVLEVYERLIQPDWFDPNIHTLIGWMTVYRPNGQGQLQDIGTYFRDWIGVSSYYMGKYDGEGNFLLYTDPNTGSWRDAAGLGVYVPTATSEHAPVPGYADYYNFSDPQNPQFLYTMEQQTAPDSSGPNASMIPEEICYSSSDGGSASATCDSFSYPEWTTANPDPYNFDFAKLEKEERPGELPVYYYYDPVTDRLSGTWIGDDRHTSYTYDIKGNVKSVIVNGDHTTAYTVDAYGRLLTKQTPLGTTSYLHDNQGRIREITDVEGRKTCYEYDARGLKTAVGSLGTTTTYQYDSWDRLITVTDHIGNKTVYAYNHIDQVVSVTDPMQNATTYAYSPTTGTLTSITDAEVGVISYEYDILGRMTKLTDQRGKATTYVYDYLNRLVSETNPLIQTTSYTYDDDGGCSSCGGGGGASGHVASVTDPAGRTTYYAYDDAGRLETVTYSGSSNTVTHTYDGYGRRETTFDNRLPIADFPTQTFSWDYDKFNRMIKETYPDGEEISWTYDINGRRKSLTDPDSNATGYMYYVSATNKKLYGITSPFGDVSFYYYNNNGFLEEEYNDTGYHTINGYDSLNRIDSIWHLDYDYMNIAGFDYTYNAASMITKQDAHQKFTPAGTLEHRVRNFTYDDVYRLKSEDRKLNTQTLWKYEYTYDPAGNRTGKTFFDGVTSRYGEFSYNDFNQSLDADAELFGDSAVWDFDYDNNGNLEYLAGDGSPTVREYFHDRENRLVGTFKSAPDPQSDDIQQDYVYDFTGRLLRITDSSGNKKKYYYDGINTLLTRAKPVGSTTCYRTESVNVLKDAAIGQIITQMRYNYATDSCSQSPTTQYLAYHYDHMGNVVAITDCDGLGTLLESFDMEAFGTVKTGSQGGIRLTTKEYDSTSGLYYFGARWYDPETGRWLEKEPLPNEGSQAQYYAFVVNNPVNDVDPNGKYPLFYEGPLDKLPPLSMPPICRPKSAGPTTPTPPGPRPCDCPNPARLFPFVKCHVTPSTCAGGSGGGPCPCTAICYVKGFAITAKTVSYSGTCP